VSQLACWSIVEVAWTSRVILYATFDDFSAKKVKIIQRRREESSNDCGIGLSIYLIGPKCEASSL
jgi:hypothetical protein